MSKAPRIAVLLMVPLFVLVLACHGPAKEPDVAGSFYPADPKLLKDVVDGYIEKAEAGKSDGRLLTLISPHAGYIYSAQVAAYGYKRLKGSGIKTVLLIGASHKYSFDGASVYAKGVFKTPLGPVRINKQLAEGLLDEKSNVRFDPAVFEGEHSLEVQLPFLQETLDRFEIVPVLTGRMTPETFSFLVEKFAAILKDDENALIVASTDLSHYHDYDTARTMDTRLVSSLLQLSPDDTERKLIKGDVEMCGAYPVLVAIEAARRAGGNEATLFKYANSGDVTGDKSRVVGYASIGIYGSPLTAADKKELLTLAREAIEEYVTNKKVISPVVENPRLISNGAAFVTIKRKESLRGCIGHIRALMPLYQSVIRNAVAASSMDPRFMPMSKDELGDMEIEISVLTPFVPVRDVKDITIGRDGLYIVKDGRSGLLLPQVPLEFGWDRDEFLKQICHKAGLPESSWRSAELSSFRAEVFSEH